jgi:hypothetical protein
VKSILLTVQGVRVKAVNSRKKYQLLDSFSDKAADVYDVIRDILKFHESSAYRAEDSQQVLEVKKVDPDKRQIEGLLEAGYYGSTSEIRSLDKWDEVAYAKKIRDVDLSPFYFLFDLPEGKELGFLLLQSTGIEGVQTLLASMLHEQFVRDFPDDRLRFHRIIPEDVRKQLAKAPLSEVRFIRHRMPSDLATVIGRAGTKQTTGTMDLVMRFKDDGIAPEAVRRFFDKKRGAESVLELEGIEFPYDNVKIKVKLNGKEHTVDLGDPDRLRANFDVTDEVTRSTAGHPTFGSISRVAKEKLSAIKAVLYGGGGNASG